MRIRTASGSLKPPPASIVSSACAAGESPSAIAAAMPPWAQALADSARPCLASTMQSPDPEASNAARMPATPPPITSTSVKICGSSGERKGIR